MSNSGSSLPSLPSGEPVLARWFVLLMILLALAGIAVTVWAFLSFSREPLTPAERRPPGTADITHERGDAVLNETAETAPGPGCAEDIDVFGDAGARASVSRAMSAACQLIASGRFPEAEAGLREWIAADGLLRVAVFEATGLESSARVEDSRVVIELNPRYQFEDATRAAPFILHELVHLASGWPGEPVDVDGELLATEVTARACDRMVLGDNPPLGCRDAQELMEADDAAQQLRDAGYGEASS